MKTFMVIEANVRYWEDTKVNGNKDYDGTFIPCRSGNCWNPVINMETGVISKWPKGTTASIHYKVCDGGKYWIVDDEGTKVADWHGDYVPDAWLCIRDRGYGDYIIFNVDSKGKIEGWNPRDINTDDRWVLVDTKNMRKDFPHIETYRKQLIGHTIKGVEFSDCDEGLTLTLDDGSYLEFGFSSHEGIFKIVEPNTNLKE